MNNFPPGVSVRHPYFGGQSAACANCGSDIHPDNDRVDIELYQKADVTGHSAKHGWKNCGERIGVVSRLETKTISACQHCRPEVVQESALVLVANGDVEDAADYIAESLDCKIVHNDDLRRMKDAAARGAAVLA